MMGGLYAVTSVLIPIDVAVNNRLELFCRASFRVKLRVLVVRHADVSCSRYFSGHPGGSLISTFSPFTTRTDRSAVFVFLSQLELTRCRRIM